MESIPVIGTAIVNGVYWLQRLIASIDYPVDNFVVFNNNGRGELTEQLDLLSKLEHPYIKKIHICHLPHNLGVSCAWNMIIKSFINSPYWIICNHDIAFTEGLLKEMVEYSNDVEIGMVHGKSGDFDLPSYDLFLIKDWVVQQYGLFDENLSPAYCEDADYIMRLVYRPIKSIKELSKPYYHGSSTEYYKTGSQTKREDPTIADKLTQINIDNFDYMNKKWGEGWRQCNPYYVPFDTGHMPISMTTFDLEYIRSKNLGF
jgi:hypothetical protein